MINHISICLNTNNTLSLTMSTEFIAVYGDTEATTCDGRGGIYQYAAQNPDQLNDKVRAMCAKFGTKNPNMQEVIELGFCFDGKKLDLFRSPRVNPKLDPFLTKLCGISQEMVDGQPTFKDGFADLCKSLADFGVDVNSPKFLAIFCGKWDFECPLTAHYLNDDIDPPVFFQRVCDIKVIFGECLESGRFPEVKKRHDDYIKKNAKPGAKPTMASMLYAFDMTLDGDHHRAHDDAANIAKIGQWLLDQGFKFRPTFQVKL